MSLKAWGRPIATTPGVNATSTGLKTLTEADSRPPSDLTPRLGLVLTVCLP